MVSGVTIRSNVSDCLVLVGSSGSGAVVVDLLRLVKFVGKEAYEACLEVMKLAALLCAETGPADILLLSLLSTSE